jgi:hypothetical protein
MSGSSSIELMFDPAQVTGVVRAKQALAELHAALDDLDGAGLDDAADADLEAMVEDLYSLDARLTGARCAVLRRFDTAKVWRPCGARSAAMWVATRTRVSKGLAGAELKLARRLGAIPATAAALEAGDITVEAAKLIAGCASGRTEDAFDAEAEAFLLAEAKRQRYRDLVRICGYWKLAVDPDGTDDDAEARYLRRGASCSQLPDGTHRVDANLDVIGGTEFAAELARLETAMFRSDLDELREQHGEGASLDLLARTPRQRRADAMVEMARRSAAMPAGARKPRPLVSVLVGRETFAGPVLETLNRTVLAPFDVARLLTEADLERIVFDGPSRVVDVGVTRRFFSGATRRAVEVRDRECTHPYCDEPADRCDVDHTIPHSRGGPTAQANGRLRCGPHNPEVAGGRPPPGPDPPDPPPP